MSSFAVLRTTLDHLSAKDLCNTGNESFNNSKRIKVGSEEVAFLLNILWVAKLVARLLLWQLSSFEARQNTKCAT
jgi:hypothetical protein